LALLLLHFSVICADVANTRVHILTLSVGRKNLSNIVRTGRTASQAFIKEATKDAPQAAAKSKCINTFIDFSQFVLTCPVAAAAKSTPKQQPPKSTEE
jgi:hypothetical protein